MQAVHRTMVRELWDHARISVHNGETMVWNWGGIAPSGLGHDDFVEEQFRSRREKHDVLLQRIPAVPNFQAAWLLLTFCFAARANFTLRTVRPALVEEFAASHNHAIWTCLVKILGIDGSAV